MSLASKHHSDSACEQCRRRKSKCDRIRPLCGSCVRANTTCVFVDERPKRGPKKGQLQALKSKVASLEQQLAERNDIDLTAPNPQDEESSFGADECDQFTQINEDTTLETVSWLDDLAATWEHTSLEFPEMNTIPTNFPNSALTSESLDLSDIVQADLVYPFAPIIHRERYFSWADQENPSLVHTSLRLAMWTLAATISAQFRSLSDRLYAATLQTLHRVDSIDRNVPWATGSVQLEEIQARLLLAHYEFIRMERHHVLLTATHAFRLVQLAGLHTVDVMDAAKYKDPFSPFPLESGERLDVILEEKRRTFWLAFCLDRLLNAHDTLTFTIQEEVIYVHLPTTEVNFQTSQSGPKHLLTEAIVAPEPITNTLAPFAQNVILTALYGRYPWDPMATFGHLLGRSAVIHLGKTAAAWTWQTAEHRLMAAGLEQRSYQAATELAHLASRLPRSSYLKAHPFLPNILAQTVAFLRRHAEMHDKESWGVPMGTT
ncbi:fungal specific transcription factor domain [Fusarium albosuccineum]|uniref:Fungal specific transcription factor domain n=1 Tax=Fusarium albosuccineum TaxID=1237068 RepID=A0A8H4KSJ4_9HYPO|nr:fungal specific transcription factor domain [Fusarium albosuccineum]